MSLPETVQFHKITIPQFHALYPYLDPNRPHELLDGQILVMPLPETPHRVVRNRLYQEFFRQECPGLHVWPGGAAPLGGHGIVARPDAAGARPGPGAG